MTEENHAPADASSDAPAAASDAAPVETVSPAPPPEEVAESVVESVPDPVPEVVEATVEAVPAELVPPEPIQSAPAASSQPVPAAKPSAGSHMRAVVRSRKTERLEKVMEVAREKRIIANDDVERLLKVSNATATRYLNALVAAGRLRRFGARKHERYEPL